MPTTTETIAKRTVRVTVGWNSFSGADARDSDGLTELPRRRTAKEKQSPGYLSIYTALSLSVPLDGSRLFSVGFKRWAISTAITKTPPVAPRTRPMLPVGVSSHGVPASIGVKRGKNGQPPEAIRKSPTTPKLTPQTTRYVRLLIFLQLPDQEREPRLLPSLLLRSAVIN